MTTGTCDFYFYIFFCYYYIFTPWHEIFSHEQWKRRIMNEDYSVIKLHRKMANHMVLYVYMYYICVHIYVCEYKGSSCENKREGNPMTGWSVDVSSAIDHECTV